MTTKHFAVLALTVASLAAAPARAGTMPSGLGGAPDPFVADETLPPIDLSAGLPGAFDLVSFQNAGLTDNGFSEVNAAGIVRFSASTRVAEPAGIATFATAMLGLVAIRRARRRG